jgi:hypothetical protein
MAITFSIPKEHRAAVGGFEKITVPDKYHDAASKRMSDQFGFSLDTVEGWSAGVDEINPGTPINSALNSLRTGAGMADAPKPAVTQTITEAAGITSEKAADIADRIRKQQKEAQEWQQMTPAQRRNAETDRRQAAALKEWQLKNPERAERVGGESFAEKSERERQEQGIGEFDPSSPSQFWDAGDLALLEEMEEASRASEAFGTAGFAGESAADSDLLKQMWGTVPGGTDSFAFQPAGGDFEAWTPEKFEEKRDEEYDFSGGSTAGAGGAMGDETLAGNLDVNTVIAMFGKQANGKQSNLGKHIFRDKDDIEIINPLLAQLIDLADMQGGRVSMEQIEAAHDAAAKEIAQFNRDAAKATAEAQGASDVDVAKIMADVDKDSAAKQRLASEHIATQRRESDEYIARQQLAGTRATAGGVALAAQHQRDATKAAAESGRLGQETAAASQAGAASPYGFLQQGGDINQIRDVYEQLNKVGLAEAAASSEVGLAQAGGASPFGFMNQAVARENALLNAAGEVGAVTPQEQLEAIYGQLNEVGLAQAAAANLAAQDNAFSFAAGAGQARNPLTGELDFNADQVAKIAANTPAGLAAKGQEAAARAGATGFGALLSGDQAQRANANAILRAQAANNPYAIQQLGQDWSDTAAADQNLRIDQILRGGLTPQQRLNEINASQSGQNFANQLNFMSNPSAVGFATERGLLGGGDNQILQDINNSPTGNVPGSFLGLNPPSAAGAGGGQTTNEPFLPTMNTLRNASDEQIGFLQGAAAAGGQTPSEFQAGVESRTPLGY